MKITSLLALSICLFATNAFAATAVCKKAASDKAMELIEKKVSDDCFQRYLQQSKTDPNTVYVGISCDHVGKYQYKIVTKDLGSSCEIVSARSKFVER